MKSHRDESDEREKAHAFRSTLITDVREAKKLLKNAPGLIDLPVYGESESALHFFSVENQIEIVRWLLAHGANPNGVSEDNAPLHEAAMLGNEEVCRELVRAGADLDRQDFLGETPLHKASAYGRLSIIELLLANGADPSILEMCGELPVDQALPRKRDQVRSVFDRFANTRRPKQ